MGIKRVPTYFNEFACIGGACEDNCCIGWEVDIDDESLEVYKSVGGEFGDKLRRCMNDENSFTLKNNRCPFLNDKNLCDIFIKSARTSSAPFVRNIRDLPKHTAV
ncbi:hypothetical protein DXA10_10505 [Firmicutes bacterium AM55-24TS]|nr:hypothetical protein DXA10_10505 [Firmicutes bacterium AM55-24TS]